MARHKGVFNLLLGVSLPVLGGALVPLTLSILTIPTISGDPVVGQRLFGVHGTYNSPPDSYSMQWYQDGVALTDATADTLLIVDAQVGSVFAYGEIPHKGGYTDPAQNPSANTAAVTDIDLTNAITAFTRTSASGVTPMTWSLTFAANVYEGYTLHTHVYSDSALTVQTQDVVHLLTNADLQSGATIDLASDGLTTIGATDWLKLTVETTSPNGNYYSFTYPTALSPTDAVVAMTWSATDKDAGVLLSGSNLTAERTSDSNPSVRATRAITVKTYIEHTIVNSDVELAVADASANLNGDWDPELFSGGAANPHAAIYYHGGFTDYNGTSVSGLSTFVAGDRVDEAIDPTNHKVWFRVTHSGVTGAWLGSGDPATNTGGVNIAAMTGSVYAALHFTSGGTGAGKVTSNFGATAYSGTPPSGFGAG